MNSFCLVVLPLVLFKTEGKKRTKSGKWGQILALTRTKVGIWRQELVEDRTRDQIEPKVGHTRDISWTWDRMWTKSGGPTLTWSTKNRFATLGHGSEDRLDCLCILRRRQLQSTPWTRSAASSATRWTLPPTLDISRPTRPTGATFEFPAQTSFLNHSFQTASASFHMCTRPAAWARPRRFSRSSARGSRPRSLRQGHSIRLVCRL